MTLYITLFLGGGSALADTGTQTGYASGDFFFTLSATTTISNIEIRTANSGLVSQTALISWNIGLTDAPDNVNTCISGQKTIEEWGIPLNTSFDTDFENYAEVVIPFSGDCTFGAGTYIMNSSLGGYVLNATINNTPEVWHVLNAGDAEIPLVLIEGINNSKNTRFLSASTSARTTTPKDVLVNISYFIDPTEKNINISSLNPTLVTVKWANRNNNTFSTLGYSIATSTGTGTVLATIPDGDIQDNGTFDLLIQFSNGGCSIGLSACPFPDSYIYTWFTLTNKTVTAVGALENYNTANLPISKEYGDCGLGDIGGCIINAGIYLFIPSATSLEGIGNTMDIFWTKIPFVYIQDIKTVVQELFPTGTDSFSLGVETAIGHVEFMSTTKMNETPLLPQLRTMISYFLWIAFAWVVYRKALGIHNTNAT